MKKYLICMGNPNDINCWSGIPYHFLKEANYQSFELEGLNLNPKNLSIFRYLWNLKKFLLTGSYSGFQYSAFFLNNLFKQSNIRKEEKLIIISMHPLLPNIINNNWRIFYYIDATTKQIFEEYNNFPLISEKYKNKILIKEKNNYKNSKLIFCMSEWTKNSLIKHYSVPDKKIIIVPGGANIPRNFLKENNYKYIIPPIPSKQNPLRIGFLGQDWFRKGGPIALEVVNQLNLKSIPSVLRVMGISNSVLPKNKHLQNIGFLDKNKNMDKFIAELKSWHFGSLFSRAEAFGISNRECLLLGVPVICNDVGGIRSTLPPDNYGCIFRVNQNPKFIADWIENQIKDYSNYTKLRDNVSNNNYSLTWEPAISNIFSHLSFYEKDNNLN
tara:strand:- start:774 stop:1925 length:1152 start_codon:yes stop_codon:yes gene_type:complete